MLPPTSVPQPIIQPFIATMTPSPPDEPPAVINRFTGFMHLPKTLLILSKDASVWGIFVLVMITQPSACSISTKGELEVAGLKHKLTKPIVVSTPLTLKVSFMLTGRPCRGPHGFPCLMRYSSSCFALAIAESNNGSVMQFVSCCAMAARLQKAVVTSTELTLRELRACKRVLMVYPSVI